MVPIKSRNPHHGNHTPQLFLSSSSSSSSSCEHHHPLQLLSLSLSLSAKTTARGKKKKICLHSFFYFFRDSSSSLVCWFLVGKDWDREKKEEEEMGENGSWVLSSPNGAPAMMAQREEERWRHFDNSVNAVSFGFVATAILISMFLVMAIFEKFLRPRSADDGRGGRNGSAAADLEAAIRPPSKVGNHSPIMSIYARGVSVLMPGQDVPTFIAHPAPVPCPPERISWPLHQQNPLSNPASN